MRSYGLYDRVGVKLVLGKNVSQKAQFVQTGSASVDPIALSLALSLPMSQLGKYWEVPLKIYPKLEQDALPAIHTRLRTGPFRSFS